MKSAIYLGKENVEVREVPVPECGDNDILIKNICSSICGTDVAVYLNGPATGHRVTVGGEFGHETVSRVAAVGKNISDVKVGDRVYPYPLYAKDDRKRAGTIGGFSEYILMPNARLDHSYYLVDDSISDKAASLIEPFTVGGRAAKKAAPLPGEKAVVFGCGTIGIAAAIMLKYLGVQNVMICDRSDFRLSIASELGFEICNVSEDYLKKAREMFGEGFSINGATADIDIWIDAAGAEAILDDFISYGKVDSRFVMVAVNNSERRISFLPLTYASKAIIGSGGYRPDDVADVMDIMKSHRWDIEKIITDEYSIDDINNAIKRAADTENAFNVTIKF